jgi:hypothetical protein
MNGGKFMQNEMKDPKCMNGAGKNVQIAAEKQ